MQNIETMNDIEIMARTIYGEARGEYSRIDGGLAALIAVGNVIMNRAQQQTWFGRTVREVCLKPYQFSCWNENDANLSKIVGVTDENPIFVQCLDVAKGVAERTYPDLTKGADHYYSADLTAPPKWAVGADECVRIGKHRFFKLADRKDGSAIV